MSGVNSSSARHRLARMLMVASVSVTCAASALPAQAAKPVSQPASPTGSSHVPIAHAAGHKVG